MRERPSARLVILAPDDSVLLFRYVFSSGPLAGTDYWATAGGALNEGESYQAAARRELFEETGMAAAVGPEIARREVVFRLYGGEPVRADERYFLVRAATKTVVTDGQEALEASIMREYRWWRLGELRETPETVYPEDLAELVAGHLDQRRGC